MNPLFVLVRHGRTNGNEKNLYRGWSNAEFAQLDEKGQQDAKDAGIYLKGLGITSPIILVDDLARTQETAKIIADILGIKEIVTDKRLRPIDVGDYTGKSKSEHSLDDFMKNRSKKIPGGESLGEFDKRQAKVFGDVLEAIAQLRKQTGKSICFIVVGHGSNASFLYHSINKGNKEVGYEGMTQPGGLMTFNKTGLEAIFKKRDKTQINSASVKGEPGTGFEKRGSKGDFKCGNCEYFKNGNACIQGDMKERSKQPKHPDGSVIVEAPDCCEYIERIGKKE